MTDPADAPSPLNGFWSTFKSSTSDRPWPYRIVAALTVAPIFIGAIRAGLTGWIPVNDAAPTVLRAKSALSFHPSLVGMYTDASGWIHTPTFFAGPWQLWWMSIPIRLLGYTWGPLLSMAALNTGWVLLAGWCVKRQFGRPSAIAALIAIGILNWSLGINALYSPVPMVMIVSAFAAFLMVAWVVMAGDHRALPAFALIGNFLILDHLVLSVLAPVIGIGALIGCGAFTLHARRSSENWAERRRRSLWSVIVAAAVTLVMWLPSVVQELTHHPGNLTNLFRAANMQPDSSTTLSMAFAAFTSLFTYPRFWLRGSILHTYATNTAPAPTAMTQILVAVSLSLLVLTGVALAVRRKDHAALAASSLGAITLGATILNLTHSTTTRGFTTGYFLSSWPAAMFISFAIGYSLIRALPHRIVRAGAAALVPMTIVLSIATIAAGSMNSQLTYGTANTERTSAELNAEVVAWLERTGTSHQMVALGRRNIVTYPYVGGLAVKLDHAGIPFCVTDFAQLDGSRIPSCKNLRLSTTIRLEVVTRSELSGLDSVVIGAATIGNARQSQGCSADQEASWMRLNQLVIAGAHQLERAKTTLPLTNEYVSWVKSKIPPGANREVFLQPDFVVDPGLLGKHATVRDQLAQYFNSTIHKAGVPMVTLPTLSDGQLKHWAALQPRCDAPMLVATVTRSR